MAEEAGIQPEFSRPMSLDRLNLGTVREELEATRDECDALAKRFGIPGVKSLRGTVSVTRPAQGPAVRVTGHITADVVQTCVVSLVDCDQHVAEDFVQRFTFESVAEPEEVFSEPEAEEPPEQLTGNALDLGEVLSEQLALALDPYPRAPGVTFEGASFGPWDEEDEAALQDSRSPFEKLRNLTSDT